MTVQQNQRGAGAFELDFDAPGFLHDPYPTYHALRAHDPVYLSPWGDWYLTRHTDIAQVLSDKGFRRQSPGGSNPNTADEREPSPLEVMISHWMLFIDPPAHTRLRRLFAGAFTPKVIRTLRPQIRSLAGKLLDDAAGNETCDLVAEVCFPLPVIVISRMLGAPAEDYRLFKDWSVELTRAIDASWLPEMQQATGMVREISAYVQDLIAARRVAPKDDLISEIVASDRQQEICSDEELVANLVMLLWAGHETTKNLIGNAALALWHHPEQWQKLTETPDLMPNAVEEFLRFDSPVQKTARWTTEATSLGGHTIPPRQCVVLLLGAANRDPEVYPEPDRLDIAREGAGNLAFGRGIHHCLGFAVAKMEAETAIAALLERASGIELATDEVVWQKTTALRGPACLPLKIHWR